jgi:hypothetical protein
LAGTASLWFRAGMASLTRVLLSEIKLLVTIVGDTDDEGSVLERIASEGLGILFYFGWAGRPMLQLALWLNLDLIQD